jgi:spermidine synthase
VAVTEKILAEVSTAIEQYIIVDRTYEGRPARVLFSGEHRSAQSGIGLDDDPDLLFDYNQRLLELANAVYPQRILVVGGGAYTLPMALAAALPDAVVDVVELDAELEPIARKYFGLTTSDRLRLHHQDGRVFIEQSSELYDLIILDVFSELAIPRTFLTLEFITLLSGRLSASGVVAMNIIASYQGKNNGLIKSQVAAYQSRFNKVTIFPAAYGLTSWLPQNLVLVAEKQPIDDLRHYIRFAPFNDLDADAAVVLHDEVS